jgi:hypothetical protein
MLKLHRISLVAATLGAVAALGVGAGVSQAHGAGDGGPGNCSEKNGGMRCEQTSEYHYQTSDGAVTITSKTTQSCRNEQNERPVERPVAMGEGEASSVGSSCVQNGHEFKMP